eukprot:evm.model.scf_796.1 EVM.evm.TU.scf_796.1   scf_796:5838-10642(+)
MSAHKGAPQPESQLLLELVTSGASVGIATSATNPIDVVKVRQQLASLKLADGRPAPGLMRTGVELVRTEGAHALTRGLAPAAVRAIVYGGLRLGLYAPFKAALGAHGDSNPFAVKVTAGLLSGTLAAGIANPIDLVKTRLQARGHAGRSSLSVASDLIRQDGYVGMWKGSVPSMARAAILTASQCATYDEVKHALMTGTGWRDDMQTHVITSMVTGLVSTTATAPVDVVKTHMFVRGNKFSGPVHCMVDILKHDGFLGLFKGWTANYVRLGPQTTITFVVLEQLRSLAGLGSV